ncbi:MAG: cell division protein FtsQ/DivIB [Neisseria sp.]|uniref:cell division protein FtsQ/DivIB n=1 Tax=Neisseria sp. TaxID=192066 RepID=UPI0026DD1308|nr:cell division protein FtsQ/DivIB [Neisseria sp.]MDO4641957.1 cell division protein FtsQ/DivIB [Neisseria sp.]
MSDRFKLLRRFRSWLVLLAVLLSVGVIVAWLYNSNYFPIKQVKIEGNLAHADNSELEKIAQKYMRGNIFQADLNGAQKAFEAVSWIDGVTINRKLPDTVEIHLVEHQPIARWKDNRLVDSNGKLFKALSEERFPAFEGEPGTEKNMVEHYNLFRQQLAPLNLNISQLIYSPRSAWSIVLDNRITIYLGRENEKERLTRFAEVWRSILKPQQAELDYVDMRYKDGFAIRKKTAGAASLDRSEPEN